MDFIEDLKTRLVEIVEAFESDAAPEKVKNELQRLLDEAILWKMDIEDEPELMEKLNALIAKIKEVKIEIFNVYANNSNI